MTTLPRSRRGALRRCFISAMLLLVVPAATAQMGGPSPVDVAVVTLGDVYQEVRLTGSIAPRRSVELSTYVAGAVREVLVDEGDFVEQGAVIARLVDTPTRLMLQETLAELALEEAALAELRNGSRIEDIDAKRGELDDARARLELAQVEADRLTSLLQTAAVSKSDVDRAQAERDRATAEMKRYEAELKRLENGARTEELARAEADVATARARCEQLEYSLSRHEIRAPFSGIIGAKMTEIGAWVGVGDPIATMAELDVVRIAAQLPERYFPDVQVGTPVSVTVDALGGDAEPIDAAVTIKVPMADQLSRTFPIRVDVPNDGLRLAPGMMARVRLAIGRERGERALLLPKDALVMSPDGSRTAWVLTPADEGGYKVMPRGVQTGREFGDQIELTGNELKVGDRVVVRGNEVLRPGQPVAVRGEGGPPSPAGRPAS